MKSNKIALVTLLTAIFGLASCSSDKNAEQNQRADRLTEPSVITKTGSISWNRFKNSPQRSLNITDAIEFPNRLKGRLAIKTNCTSLGMQSESAKNLPLKTSYQIFEFLEEHLLSQLMPNQTISCTFDFVATFESGDAQVFGLQSVEIQDKDLNHPLQVASPDSSQQNIGLNIQSKSQAFDLLKVICTDIFSKANSAENLSLTSPEYFSSLDLAIQRPGQVCRVFTFKKEQLIGLSNSFYYILNAGLPITEVQSANDWNLYRIHRKSFDPTYSITKISNPHNHPMQLKIPKQGPNFKFQVATQRFGDPQTARPLGVSVVPGKSWFSLSNFLQVASENSESWIIELKPQESVEVALRTELPRLTCFDRMAQTGLAEKSAWIEVVEKVNGQEIYVPLIEISTATKQASGHGLVEDYMKRRSREGKARCVKL